MTIHKSIFRVAGNEHWIRNYKPKIGIESVVKPYQAENNIFDVMFRTSDMNPCLSERLLMEDINREVERMKFIFGNGLKEGSDRMRDSQFKKDLENDKTWIRFRDFEDSENLKTLDEFKSKAETIYGNENLVTSDPRLNEINEEYIKAKKKYLSLIDSG